MAENEIDILHRVFGESDIDPDEALTILFQTLTRRFRIDQYRKTGELTRHTALGAVFGAFMEQRLVDDSRGRGDGDIESGVDQHEAEIQRAFLQIINEIQEMVERDDDRKPPMRLVTD